MTLRKAEIVNEVGESSEAEARANKKPLVWQNQILLAGSGLLVSAISQEAGIAISRVLPFFDKATWTSGCTNYEYVCLNF